MQINKKCGKRSGILMLSLLLLPTMAMAQSDIQFTLDAEGTQDYLLTSVSSEELFDGELPANDPTLTLVEGTR